MTKLYGLLGETLMHSVSPEIHSMIYDLIGIKGYYHRFEVKKENLKDAIMGFKAIEMSGLNVTIPYKIDVMKYLDCVSLEAENIGAVNTIKFKDGKLSGYNTDYFGFGLMLKKFNVEVKNKNVLVLGFGGASKMAVQYLSDNNAKNILIATRDVESARKRSKKDLNFITYDEIKNIKDGDIIVNCTPVGMYPKVSASPVSKEDVSRFKAAVDIIFNPSETLFLKYAKEAGIKAVNGLYMLVSQAVKSEEIWNDVKIDDSSIDRIFTSVERLMEKR